MPIRKAEEHDIPALESLLSQVLQIHADARPDLFLPHTAKYTTDELKDMLQDPRFPIFVDEEGGKVLGYAFCQLQHRLHPTNMTDIQTLFIDDLCVDQGARGKHVGKSLYRHVRRYAKEQGCYHVTLNVWSFNRNAISFYRHMGMEPMEYVMEDILDKPSDL